jgi:hypothetical protein
MKAIRLLLVIFLLLGLANTAGAASATANVSGTTTNSDGSITVNLTLTVVPDACSSCPPSGSTLPVVTTDAATNLTASSATLNGTVNPNGLPTTYYFEYGTTTSYGKSSTPLSAGSGTSANAVTLDLSPLTPNTYHYHLVATNSGGTSPGGDKTFTISSSSPPGNVFSAATSLVLNTNTTFSIAPGSRKYFKFTVPAGLKYFRVALSSWDQLAVDNMIVQSGSNAADYFDTCYQWYDNHVAWGRSYTTTIDGTQIWANMNNNAYGQNVTVYTPITGDYYIVTVNEDQQRTASVVITLTGGY